MPVRVTDKRNDFCALARIRALNFYDIYVNSFDSRSVATLCVCDEHWQVLRRERTI